MAYPGTGIPLHALDFAKFTGTTSATGDDTSAKKVIMPKRYTAAIDVMPVLNGEEVYLEDADYARDGVNFPTAITAGPAVNPAYLVGCKLTDDLFVYAYDDGADGNDGHCFAVSTVGTVCTVGTAVVFEASGATDPALCRLSDTTFACAYLDEGDSDYLKVVIGTVAGTVISYGTVKSTALACTATDAAAGVSICKPYEGTDLVFIAFQIASGTDGSTICIPYTGTTFGTQTLQVEFDQDAPVSISCCRYSDGFVAVAYNDAGDSGKLHCWPCTVSTAGAVVFGTEKTLNAAASTVVKVSSPRNGILVFSYIVAGDATIIATTASFASTPIVATAGTAVAVLGAATHTGVRHAMMDDTRGFCVADDGTYLKIISFSQAAKAIAADAAIDTAVEARYATEVSLLVTKTGKVVIAAADASDEIQVIAGQYFEDRIVDIRSVDASASYNLWLFPQYKTQDATAV